MGHNLFSYNNILISAEDFKRTLLRMKVDDCDVLYIHTSINFGQPNLSLGRTGILESLGDVLYGLKIPTLIMPSYTFSFCNDEIFNKQKTPSSMGALNEYLRIHHQWSRSDDPLMSNILYGEERGLLTRIGNESIGHSCTFDLLNQSHLKVKFLFLGPRIHDCFTFMHYLEYLMKVPYRYDYKFRGKIIDGEKELQAEYALYIRDEGVKAGGGAKIYENILIESGLAKYELMGMGSITSIDLIPAKEVYLDLLKKSPNFFIEEVFLKPIRPLQFERRKMVAL